MIGRPLVRFLTAAAVLAAIGVAVGFTAHVHRQRVCQAVEISLATPPGEAFLDRAQVWQLIGTDTAFVGRPLGEISLRRVEEQLLATGYAEEVVAAYTAQDQLHLKVRLRRPIARVFDRHGKSCYLDSAGRKLPVSARVTARCPLVRGNFTLIDSLPEAQEAGLSTVLPLLRAMDADSFFRAFVSELHISATGEVTLFPQVGDMEIELGKPVHVAEKMAVLRTFLREVAARKGYDYYRSISLAFRGQVVARRQSIPSDTE